MKIAGININQTKLSYLQDLFGILRNSDVKQIIDFIELNPGACNRQVFKILDCTEQNTRFLLNKMKDVGLLDIDLELRKSKNGIPYVLNLDVLSKAKRICEVICKEVNFSTAYSIVRSLKSKPRCEAMDRIEGENFPMQDLELSDNQNTRYFSMFRKVGILEEDWEGKKLLLSVNKKKLRKIFY